MVNICRQSREWITVEPLLLVYMFASFLTYPTFQQLLYHSVCSVTPNCTEVAAAADRASNKTTNPCAINSSDPVQDEVRAKVSHWILYNNLAASVPSIIAALLYGSLSEMYGRRIFIVLPAVGGILNAIVVLTVAYTVPLKIHYYLVGSFLSGLTGSYSIFNFAVYSYMTDISSLRFRTFKLSILESMTYFGATVSSFVSGVWIREEGYIPPYWCILTCYILVILYALLLLPSTVSYNRKATSAYLGTNSSDHFSNHGNEPSILADILQRILQFVTILCTSWRIALLCLIFFVVEINFLGITDIVILYCINRLCWPSDWIGYFLGSKVLLNGVAALIILPVMNAVFHIADTSAMLIGLVSGIGALVLMGSATSTWMMLLAPVIGGMRGCVVPVIRSSLSKLTPPTLQGVMFSGVSILEASSMLIASVVYNALFPVTYSISPGFCFYLMILILIIPISCTVALYLKQQNQKPSKLSVTEECEDQPLVE